MKKGFMLTALIAMLMAVPIRSQAHDYDRDDSDHPLRYIGYALHPLGIAVEYGVLRPIHCFVSATPRRNLWFGHDSYGKGCDDQAESVTVSVVPEGDANAGSAAGATNDEHAQITGVRPLDQMMTIYFDYDRSAIRKDQMDRIDTNVKFLKEHPELSALIEGNCDERGTNEYNLALGERRARTVMDYYIKAGIPASRLTMISKGEEQPVDPGHDESAWAKNRRVEHKEPIKDK